MSKRSVSGVRKERMTTMEIAIFVTLTLNVAMQEKHNYYNMLLKINKGSMHGLNISLTYG